MPQQYCYAGYVSEVGRIKLDRVGQTVSLSDEAAKDAIRGGCVLLPKEAFDSIGFTEDELKQFGHCDKRRLASAEFNAKVALAVEEYGRIRGEFE